MAPNQIECKAAYLKNRKLSRLFMVDKMHVSPPSNGEVRVKVMFTGVCNTDIEYIRNPRKEVPDCSSSSSILLGQEASGIIESVGPGVSYVRKGDHVLILRLAQCGNCFICKFNPNSNMCQFVKKWPKGESKVKIASNNETLMSGIGIGSFSEYITVPVELVTKIDSEFPLDQAAVIASVFLTGYGAAVFNAKVHFGSICAVYGLGALGLATIAGCKAAGAQLIIAIDVNQEKFANAKALGATHFINPLVAPTENGRFETLFEEISASGFEYVFECSRSKTARESGISNLTPWGTFVAVCYVPGSSYDGIILDIRNINKGQTIKGGLYGGMKPREGVKAVIQQVTAKKLNLDQFISKTKKISLNEINKGFDWYKSSEKALTLIEM